MAKSEDLISAFLDEAAIKKQADNFITQLNNIYALYNKINDTKITLSGVSGISEITKTTTVLNNNLKDLGTSTNNLQQNFVQLGPAIAGSDTLIQKINARVGTLGEALAGVQLVIKENNAAMDLLKKSYLDGSTDIETYIKAQGVLVVRSKELKAQQQELNIQLNAYGKSTIAVGGSSDDAANKLGRLRDIYRTLTDAEKADTFGQDLKKSIDQLDPALKQADASIGNFQRNVGDYANAFGQGFGVIQQDLKNLQDQINSGSFSGDQLDALKNQEQVLLEVTQQLSKEFTTTEAQTRAFKNAAAEIGVAFGIDSKTFQDFKDQVGQSALALNEIKKSVKDASSETPGLDKLIHAATGIAGAFAVAQGAAALFGADNEELQKTFVKLQATMTILNGLQQISNELKNRDSILRKAVNFLTGAQVKLTQQQTLAQEANTVASNAATTATVRFGVALKALTIGGLLLLLPLLVSAMEKLSASTNVVNKYLGEGSGKTKLLNDSLKELGDTSAKIADGAIKNLQDEMKKVNDELGLTPTALEQVNAALKILDAQVEEINSKGFLNKLFNNAEYSFALKQIQDKQKELKDVADQSNKLIGRKTLEDDLKNTTELIRTQTTLQAGLIIDANNRIVANDKSSNAQKTAALKSSFEQQNILIQQQLNSELDGASKSDYDSKQKAAEAKANNARIINQRDLNDKIEALNKTSGSKTVDNSKEVADAQYQLQKTVLTHVSDFLKERAADESQDYTLRLAALKAYYDKEQELNELDLKNSLSKSTIPAERERLQLEAQYKSQSLQKQFAAESTAISQDQANKELTIIETENAKKLQAEKDFEQGKKDLVKDELEIIQNGSNFNDTVYATQYANEERLLYESFQNKEITQSEYQEKSLALQYEFQKKQIQNDINTVERSLQVSNLSFDEKAALEKKLAELKLALAKATGAATDQIELTSIEKLKAAIESLGAIFQNLGDIMSEVAGIGFDKQNADIQTQMDLLDEKRQKEIEVANATITNEQDKAAAIITINARADAQQKILEDRKRQLQQRQAAYDKASTIAQIITRTALAVVTVLSDSTVPGFLKIPLAITVGALGLAQIARAIAAPLPQFKHGKTNSYEGFAEVGDGGQHEVIDRGGSIEVTPATSTVTYIRKQDKVYSSIDKYLEKVGRPRFKHLSESAPQDRMGDFIGVMDRRLVSVENAIKNKKETHFTVTPYGLMAMQKDMQNKINYLNDNLHF